VAIERHITKPEDARAFGRERWEADILHNGIMVFKAKRTL